MNYHRILTRAVESLKAEGRYNQASILNDVAAELARLERQLAEAQEVIRIVAKEHHSVIANVYLAALEKQEAVR